MSPQEESGYPFKSIKNYRTSRISAYTMSQPEVASLFSSFNGDLDWLESPAG